MSTFSGLQTATTSLWAQRRGLDVTGQNIANVNTDGYSRQRAELRAMGGAAVPGFFSTSPGIGGGVAVADVTRIRDAFLEGRGHLETATSARLTQEADALALVEQATREPGDNGIQSLLADMWNGWGDVHNQPDDEAARAQVLERLTTLVEGIRFGQTSLDAQWGQTRENLDVLIRDVNATATAVAELNAAIQAAVSTGQNANDLTDRRDLLVMKLAEQVGATVRPVENGGVTVMVGGITLVSGGIATELAVAGTLDPDDVDPDVVPPVNPPRVVTATGSLVVTVGGTAQGQLGALTSIVPAYRDRLDDLAVGLANVLNTAHTAGFDLNGDAGTPLLGSTSGPISAKTLTVLISDPARVAASSVAPTAGSPALDARNADAIAQLRLLADGPDAGYRRMVVELGVQAAVADRNLSIQQVITAQVHAARDAVAGVNLDEEMTTMLSYQHAYSAAGRLVTAIDQMLDVLISRTGVVGR